MTIWSVFEVASAVAPTSVKGFSARSIFSRFVRIFDPAIAPTPASSISHSKPGYRAERVKKERGDSTRRRRASCSRCGDAEDQPEVCYLWRMAQPANPGSDPDDGWRPPAPDVSHLITEDGKPLDSFLSEKQMRLLTATLYSSWTPPNGRRFLAAMNVGVFAVARNPAIVPDVFLSLDVDPPVLTGPDRLRSYFIWEFGKPPDIAIEVVSDTEGDELSSKLREYERMRVGHYVVFDPLRKISKEVLTAFSLQGLAYVMIPHASFQNVGLALVVWEGEFEGIRGHWLRWTDLQGNLIPTGAERADAATERADAATQRADAATQRADELAAKLRALGVDPDA